MADLYDKDGNLLQGAMTAEEVQAAVKAATETEAKPLRDRLAEKEAERVKQDGGSGYGWSSR